MSFEKLIQHKTYADCRYGRKPAPSVNGSAPFDETQLDAFSSDYASNYFNHNGNRIHYIDTRKGRYARTAFCLHSRFGWAYSFRKIIPRLVYHGFRVVAADMLGFGLSDKSTDPNELTIAAQSARMRALIEHLGLTELTLIGHEMGASVASQLPKMLPSAIEALIFANPANQVTKTNRPGLHLWRTLMNARQDIDLAQEIARICPSLSNAEFAAYTKPMLAKDGLFALRHFNSSVVLDETSPDYALLEDGQHWLREQWTGRTLVVAGTNDPMFGIDTAKQFCEQIGCQNGVIQLKDVCGHPFEQEPQCINLLINELFAAR